MWAKNLLFIGVVLGGVALLRASLIPLKPVAGGGAFDASQAQATDFQEVVKQVDAVFRQEWETHGVQPASRASDLQIARRLSLALTGSAPSLEEIRALEQQPSEMRLAGYASNLISDRRFTDYWAERLARVYVGTEDGPFIVFRRRRFTSWLSDQLMARQSYDAIVRSLIASQGMTTDKPAVNFITVNFDMENKDQPNAERLAGRVARAFLGVRIDCSRCHDQRDGWSQKDFQGLAAFFGQTHKQITNIVDKDGEFTVENRKTQQKETIAPAVPFFKELLPEEGSRRERLAAWVTHPKNTYFARGTVQRVWALMFGKPLNDSVEFMNREDVPHAAIKLLADDFASHDYNLHRLIQVIAATQVFQLDSACDPEPTDAQEDNWAVFPMTRLRPEQVAGSILQAASVRTIDQQSHVLTRLARAGDENNFIKRYGDTGEDEFDGRGGTIPQSLLRLNGDMVHNKTKAEMLTAVGQIAAMAPTDKAAVEVAYLTVLTRRPTPRELDHFIGRLTGRSKHERQLQLQDLCWVLLNATEASWNH